MNPTAGHRARDRRAIAAGVIVCATILMLGRGVPALRSAERNARHRLEVARARVNGLQPLLTLGKQDAHESPMMQLFLIRLPSDAEVSAELSRHVTALARFSGVEVHSVTPTMPRRGADRSGPFVTGVTVSATGETPAVLKYLRELELGRPAVGVAALQLVRQGASATADLLRVELTLQAVAELSRATEGR